jgi:hypothetical protein
MKARPVFDSWYCAPPSKNALRSPSNSDMWVCMPEPGWSLSGFGMKDA